jgi:hypothetical protein
MPASVKASVELHPNPRVRNGFLRCVQFVGWFLLLGAAFRIASLTRYTFDALRMHGWEEVPATVLEADFKIIEPGQGEQVVAKYRYRHDGKDYEGTRVEVAETPQIITAFQKQMVQELNAHAAGKSSAVAYVNPADPTESVLYPQFRVSYLAFRLGVIFLLLLAGYTFVRSVSWFFRNERDRLAKQQTYPNEPWMWRAEWADKVVVTRSYKFNRWVVAFVAFYLLVALPLAFLVMREWGQEIVSTPGIILMVVGLALFSAARLQLKHGKTFKGAEFRMSALPGIIGGPLAGAVVLKGKAPDDTKFRVVLECLQRRHSTGDDEQSTHEAVEWRDMVTVDKTIPVHDVDTSAIPVYFAIPYDANPTGEQGRTTTRWLLKAGIEEENFHRYATFEVPVFKTAESSRQFKPDPTVLQPYESAVDAQTALSRLCRIESLADGGQRYRFSYFDTVVFVIAMVLTAICAGGIAAIFYFKLHPAWAILPGLFGLMFFVGSTLMALWGSSLQFDRDHVNLESGYAPFRKHYRVAYADVLSVEAAKEHSAGEQDHFCLAVKIRIPISQHEIDDRSDLSPEEKEEELEFLRDVKYTKKVTIIKRLERRNHADATCKWLSEKLRLIPTAP